MIVGIDLGTTYCAVSHLDDRGRPVMIPNRDGDILTPSAVYLAEDGHAVVGQPAIDLSMEHPERVATMVKRSMGMPKYTHAVAGREFRPETLSAIILRKLVLDAENHVGPIKEAVITVPAYFDDTRRKATQDAGRIAGLDVLDILDEPSAAGLAYTVQSGVATTSVVGEDPMTVLVYDLGGGTFDVTLVSLKRKRFQVLGIEGDVRLGGRDWDDRIVNHVAEKFREQHGEDPREDPQSLAMLIASAERAKRALSKLESTSVTCAHHGRKMQVPFSRSDFERVTADLLLRTRMTAQEVVDEAKLTWADVDKVLMVGGSTHMPMCTKALKELTGKEPDRSLAVSEVVARGAAVHAGLVAARRARERGMALPGVDTDIVEISVNAHSLGIEIRNGDERINDKIVKKNTQLPAAVSRVYYTVKEGQSKVRVRVLQGEAQQAAACIAVGECWVEGLPSDLVKGSPIQVRCGVGANGIIEVMALDMTSGRMARTEIRRTSGLTDEDIAREAEWVKSLNIQ